MGPAHQWRAVLVRFGGGSLRSVFMAGAAVAAILALIAVLAGIDRGTPAGEATGEVVRVGVVEGQVSHFDNMDRQIDVIVPSKRLIWCCTWPMTPRQ